ncbi:MAG: hypothetical protein R3266_09890, partial [Gemmatimonadota bacterium]|nr:hypothetical protein [Gemmatimonadota bacterium]
MRTVRRFRSRPLAAALLAGAGVLACGGDGGPTSPPPGPPPPPPPPPVGASLDLQPGEVRVLADDASLRRFELVGASGPREYQVIVMSGSQTEDGFTPVRFAASASASASVVPPEGETLAPPAAATAPPAVRAGRPTLE